MTMTAATTPSKDAEDPLGLVSRIIFRSVQPTDIPRCHQIEASSYPEDEAASKAALQYRQHHAAPFFRCAFLIGDSGNPGSGSPGGQTSSRSSVSYQGRTQHLGATIRGTIIGFICATRCKSFTAEAMKVHDGAGKTLAIHSVVVGEQYRNCGVASAMMQDYLLQMERLNEKMTVRIEKFVLLAKAGLLAFYVKNGFAALRASPVVHGADTWFECERRVAAPEERDGTHRCFIVDSFADETKRGTGNPASVVLLRGPPGERPSAIQEAPDRGGEWMAAVAKEFGLSETAFVWPLPSEAAPKECVCSPPHTSQLPVHAIRYYTKTGVEVDLCGHATLAAASVLLNPQLKENPKQTCKVSFVAKKDALEATLVPPLNVSPASTTTNKASRISMKFPWKKVTPIAPAESDVREEVFRMMSRAFSAATAAALNPAQPPLKEHILHIGTTDEREDLLVELTEEGFDWLKKVTRVDYGALSAWQGYSRGVIVCCAATAPEGPNTPAVDFRSRFFGPKVGIDEDPVTGSAHGALGPYFGEKMGKNTVVGRQESERGGVVECILKPEEGAVYIVGTAVMTVSGTLSMSI